MNSPDALYLGIDVGGTKVAFRTPLSAVGVAMPATIGTTGRITAWPSRPEWTGPAMGASLLEMFPGTVVAWADDGDLGALAEAQTALGGLSSLRGAVSLARLIVP